MKIAIISMIREPWGGSEEIWADMTRELLKDGHTVIHSTFAFPVLAPRENELIAQGLQHIPRRGWIAPGTPALKRIFTKFIYRLQDLVENPFEPVLSRKPDYILYNGSCYSIASEKQLLRALRKSRVPFGIIAHYNRDDGKDVTDLQAQKISSIFEQAKNVFFVSQRTLDVARKRTRHAIPNAIIIRNPVNMPATAPVAYPDAEPLQFAMVGNLRMVHKGQDIAMEVLAADAWKERNWHVNIYGNGEDKEMLLSLTKKLELGNKITFHGKTSDIRGLWACNHLLLMPSRMEGMPLAVVEAMLCGRAAVVTDVGGHSEWIEDGKEGFIAESATVDAYGTALERAWAMRSYWQEIGARAHQKAMRLYDPAPGKTLFNHIKRSIANK